MPDGGGDAFTLLTTEPGPDVAPIHNRQMVSEYQAEEWPFNRADKTAPPQVCVALSGGGARAASFSIGVSSDRGT